MKWFKRLMVYAVEIGVRDDNPCLNLKIEIPKPRKAIWEKEEILKVIELALNGRKSNHGDTPARPSIAVATAIAYDTSMDQHDILKLTKAQWDGQGLSFKQTKVRDGEKKYALVSDETTELIKKHCMNNGSIYLICCETKGMPYVDEENSVRRPRQSLFQQQFRKFKRFAMKEMYGKDAKGNDIEDWVEPDVNFRDLRRTALTEFAKAGATEAELCALSGHKLGSRILNRYVKGDKVRSINSAKKRWGEISND